MLRKTFIELVQKYTTSKILTESLWQEVEGCYTGKGRHYHTLSHLDDMLTELLQVKDQVEDWDSILLSMFYHDIVYNPLSTSNEEDSTQLAKERLCLLQIPHEVVEKCVGQILATKTHTKGSDNDTSLLIDADLAILGKDKTYYTAYATQVRMEYSMYSDSEYYTGRKKVLSHFLGMDRIYKTTVFFEKYEQTARQNIAEEL